MGGTCTGEHGIGLGKMDYLVDELGPETIGVMHTIKQALDPLNLLNPGKIFTPESIAKGYAKRKMAPLDLTIISSTHLKKAVLDISKKIKVKSKSKKNGKFKFETKHTRLKLLNKCKCLYHRK